MVLFDPTAAGAAAGGILGGEIARGSTVAGLGDAAFAADDALVTDHGLNFLSQSFVISRSLVSLA